MVEDTVTPDEVVTDPLRLTSAEALDAAFSGAECELVRDDGRVKRFAAHQWAGPASAVEIALFIDPCEGATLDVGCGPGRLTAAAADKGLPVLGIDISAQAVRLTRARGGAAVQQDIFDEPPGTGRWQHVLLADGNIGLGGDPVRLLQRVCDLLDDDGTVLVEVAGPGMVSSRERVRLRVGDRTTDPFEWATVGVDEIEDVAASAGFVVTGVRSLSNRHVATLARR